MAIFMDTSYLDSFANAVLATRGEASVVSETVPPTASALPAPSLKM